jgi:1-acyl-sn-glycerol-3-phosphate acyltransferase
MKLLRLAYEYLVLYAGLLFFGLLCLAWSLPATVLAPLLPRRIGAPLGQFVIMAVFRAFIFVLNASGIVKCDLRALDALRHERSVIIAPNHPSLIDVVLIASRLPHVVCIMKADIWDNPLLGGGARLAGYIRNDSPASMVRLAAAATRNGSQLLVFPEGTRTVLSPINDFKGGFGLIAKTAGVPIQTVFIEANSPFLGKGWPLFKKPDFPLVYRARLGQRFEVHGDVKTFVAELEDYYRQQLNVEHLGQSNASPLAVTLNA